MATSTIAVHDRDRQADDYHVIHIVRNGDVDAFAVLVDRYYGRLTRHLTYQTGDPELGADLAQDAFLEAFRHLDRFDGRGPFAGWLYGIAHNRLRMHWRRQRLRRVVSLEWLMAPESNTTVPTCLRLTDDSSACDEQDVLIQVFGCLSLSLREALLLHSLDGFTAPEVAHILGISRAAAERRISRAKEQFRHCYQELNDERRTTRG